MSEGFRTRFCYGGHVWLLPLVAAALMICPGPAVGQQEDPADSTRATARRSILTNPPETKKDEAKPSPKPVDRDRAEPDEEGKIKIDPDLQKRIDDLLKQQDPKSRKGAARSRPRAGDPRINRPGARDGGKRPTPRKPKPAARKQTGTPG